MKQLRWAQVLQIENKIQLGVTVGEHIRIDVKRSKDPTQIKLHPEATSHTIQWGWRGKHTRFLGKLFLALTSCVTEGCGGDGTMPMGEHLHAHLIVQVMVRFLGLLAVDVIFLTLRVMKNTCWMLRIWAHTCCCWMVWLPWGIGGPHVLLCFSLSRIFDRRLATVERYIKWGGIVCVFLLGSGLRTFSKN